MKSKGDVLPTSKGAKKKGGGRLTPNVTPNATSVEEWRSFDAMGRLKRVFTVSDWFGHPDPWYIDVEYDYDAVGSARRMIHIPTSSLSGQVAYTTTTWEYDDRYRLTNETVAVADTSSPVNRSTDYIWDSADNRLSKTLSIAGGSPATTTYGTNALNQMTGWDDGTTNVDYLYDANGARTNMVRTAGGSPATTTTYTYDADNRLVTAIAGVGDPGEATSQFKYDYRSRRYHRSTPTEETYHIFDGGLSVQEYDATSILTPQASSL